MGQNHEQREKLIIERQTPAQVLAYHHGLEDEWLAEQHAIKTCWSTELPDDLSMLDTELNRRYHEHIRGLKDLPARNREHAVAVYSLFARSEHTFDRELIAYMMHQLARTSPGEGIQL